jgi:hypothetical protein
VNLDIFGNWQGGAIRDAGDEAIRKYGKDALNNIDIGMLESAYGATDDHVRNYIKNKQQGALNDSELRARAINAGLVGADGSGGADFGDTTGSYLAKIVKQEKDVKKQDDKQARQLKIEDEGRALTQATTLKNMDLQAGRDQYAHQTQTQEARYAHERNQNRMDRRHQSELSDQSNDLQMQMSLMQSDLAEKKMEYDRETRRMDKRSAAIAQLMSGLGSLGGAFAL